MIGTPPFPAGLPPGRANLQAAAVLALLYAHLYGNALLAGSTQGRLANPVVSVFSLGALMLLAVGLGVRRDPDWRGSLALQKTDAGQALLFGGLGVLAAYGANIVIVGGYLMLRGGLAEQLDQKAQWASKLGGLPLGWVLPLAVFVGLWEEIVFRGFLLGRLRVAFGAVPENPRAMTANVLAVVVSGVLFGAGHGYQGALGLVQTSVIGITLGALTVWRKSLWPAVIAHLTIDTFGLLMLRLIKPALEELSHKGLPH